MQSLDDFEDAMKENRTYMSTLIKSLGNVLDAFYKNIKTVGVSAVTGQGMNGLFKQIEKCKQQYYTEYKPMLIKKMEQRKQREEEEKKKQMEKIEKDAMNHRKKMVYKQETMEENMEKLMNMGLNDDDEESENEDEVHQIADDEDEILKFLQSK